MRPTEPRGKITNWDTLEHEPDPPGWAEYDAEWERLEGVYGTVKVFDYKSKKGKYDRISPTGVRTAMELYTDTAGEIEARDAAWRKDFPDDKRRKIRPNVDNEDAMVRFSARGGAYNPIREQLAKEELDRLSEMLGDHFPLSGMFDSVMRADDTPLVVSTIKAGSVVAKNGKIFKAAKDAFRSSFGVKTTIHIGQLDLDANLYVDIARESVAKAIGNTNIQATLDIIPHLKEIMENSVLLAVERPSTPVTRAPGSRVCACITSMSTRSTRRTTKKVCTVW